MTTGRNTVLLSTIVVVSLMLTCSIVPVINSAVTDGDSTNDIVSNDEYKYISIGDSMTVGYGLSGYYSGFSDTTMYTVNGFLKDVDGTYPSLVAEYLSEQLTDKTVNHIQLGISGSRTADIRCLLDDDFKGDSETVSYYDGNSAYSQAVKYYSGLAEELGIDTSTNEGKFELLQAIYRTELADADLVTLNCHYD